jgi:hypothetical protein
MIDKTVTVAIIVSIPPTLVSLLALRRGNKNSEDIHEVHLSINSRMTQLIEATKGASKAEGREEGRKENQ